MGQAWKARLDNQSPFTLKVTADQGSTYLAPFSSVLVCGGGGPASVNVAVQAQTAAPVSGVTPQLFATWAISPDDVPPVGAAGGSPTAPFYRFRDEFYWPAISGESFAPTLSAMVYSSRGGRTDWVSNGGASAPGSVTFPQVPRVSPISGLASITLDWWVQIAGVDALSQRAELAYGQNSFLNTPQAGIGKLSGSANYQAKVTNNPDGAIVTTDLGVAPTAAAWDKLTLAIDASGVLTWQVNGVTRLTDANPNHLWTPGLNTANLTPTISSTNGSGGSTPYISQFRASYS